MYESKEAYDRRAVAEIDLNVFRDNCKNLQGRIGKAELMCVVKANGYGHGAVTTAKACASAGVKNFGIATAGEGIELRKGGITENILLLSHTCDEMLHDAIAHDLTMTVESLEYGKKISEVSKAQNKTTTIHIKIDTGMARVGFAADDASFGEVAELCKLDNIRLTGAFTHLAVADPNNDFSITQLDSFLSFVNKLEANGIKIACKHVANSGGIFSDHRFNNDLNMARAGIILYGYSPSDKLPVKETGINPPLSLKSFVSFLKTVEPGTSIGYSRTFFTDKKTVVATLPIGYADGYSRKMSNKGTVLIRGQKAKIIGNVCMDMLMVDVTDIEGVCVGDEAVLLGVQGSEEIRGEELAAIMGTIEYELLTGISARVKRVYIN